ncbi:hypothetical protein H6F43_07245 [Leptolyngbya sp. FACHB-36]|uniref:hypothetical protein n=1 Tax=Leptolyngbya sp. FACHB-36 TaxID=2692808 RepID=UPI0016815060|nr:hypothetical protein [Leptolyngbya sp. FACHB-36]MBD2019981.1 hypothetical protein [Leptolyngbya sp. FACHB-36]
MQRILIVVLLIVGGASAGLFYAWRQATQLPSWYAEQSTTQPIAAEPSPLNNAPNDTPNDVAIAPSPSNRSQTPASPQAVQSPQQQLEARVAEGLQKTSDRKNVTVQLGQRDLNHLLGAEIARKAKDSGFGSAVKGVNTTIQNGKIESGAVVNLAEIPLEQLPSSERDTLSKLVQSFPNLGNQQFYIGVEGKPIVKNGQVQWDDNTRVKLGNLSLTTAEIAERFGVPEAEVRRQIEMRLRLGELKVNDIEVVGDQAIIQGAADR